jgi:hypothetical protein
VIACYEHHTGATFGMPQYSAYYIGMTLFPSPFVLLDFPRINDIAYKVESIARVVLEKIIELFRLAVFCTQVDITHKNTSISLLHQVFN